MDLAKFLALAGAAAAISAAVVGPALRVLADVRAGRHPVVSRFQQVYARGLALGREDP